MASSQKTQGSAQKTMPPVSRYPDLPPLRRAPPKPIVMRPETPLLPEFSALTLVAKVLSFREKPVTVEEIIRVIDGSWNMDGCVTVHPLRRNIFLLEFENDLDVSRAWDYRPWSVRGAHMLLQQCVGKKSLSEIDLNKTAFWVQLRGLPGMFHTQENAEGVAKMLGPLLDTKIVEYAKGQRSTRIRVIWDIRNPLQYGFPITVNGETSMWVSLRYEKLSEFCVICGILGHLSVQCRYKNPEVEFVDDNWNNRKDLGYWMRAPPTKYQPRPVDDKARSEPLVDEPLVEGDEEEEWRPNSRRRMDFDNEDLPAKTESSNVSNGKDTIAGGQQPAH